MSEQLTSEDIFIGDYFIATIRHCNEDLGEPDQVVLLKQKEDCLKVAE